MLKHAGACVRDLFEDVLVAPPVAVRAVGKVEQIESIRRLPPQTLKYSRRNGRFLLEIVGHPEYGVPFGQDRLVLLWLATAAVRQKSPVVRFGSATEILVEWGMQTNGSHFRRLHDGFRRVFGSRRKEGREYSHTFAGIPGGTQDPSNAGRYRSRAGAGEQSRMPRLVHVADVAVLSGQRCPADSVVRSDGTGESVGCAGLREGAQVPGTDSPVARVGSSLLAGMPGSRGEQRSLSRTAPGNRCAGKTRSVTAECPRVKFDCTRSPS